MQKLANIFVSVVYVVDHDATDVAARVKAIAKLTKARYANYEIAVIENGIASDELTKLKSILSTVACVRIIRLSRAHDLDTAIFAGVEASIGDYICTLYNHDPVELIPDFITRALETDLVFGVATNLKRSGVMEEMGAKGFYWYSKRYLGIDIPKGSTYFICMNRTVANALTRSGRFMRHIRHMSKRIGFSTTNLEYELPDGGQLYAKASFSELFSRAIDLISNYSSHPLRTLSYFGIVAGLVNIVYAAYVVVINLSQSDVAKGWTTLSLQSAFMFFILFTLLAVLAEYIGKILNESQHEPAYHIMQELSSTVSIADETRRNVTK